MSSNLIKIHQRIPGENLFKEPSLPSDMPREEMQGTLINPRVLEPYLGNPQGMTLQGIAIGPEWRIEDGVCISPTPTRYRIFSPVLAVPPDNQLVLQYICPFIDLIWLHERLGLTAEVGKQIAHADLEVLVHGIAAGIPPQHLAQDPFESVATHCERACDELFALVDNPNTKEHHVQNFLDQAANRFLLSPHSINVIPQKTLAGLRFKIDFAVQKPDKDYHLVEIESPNTLIYQEKGEEPRAEFTHAIQQVEDWLRYIEGNRFTVQKEDSMPTIYKPTGEVVIGRDKHMTELARRRFDYKRSESQRITMKTYDMMIADGRAYAASLRRMKGQF